MPTTNTSEWQEKEGLFKNGEWQRMYMYGSAAKTLTHLVPASDCDDGSFY